MSASRSDARRESILAVLIPLDRGARGVVVLDADVDSHIERVAMNDRRMMRMVDARVPHFGRDECFLGGRPAVLVKTHE